MDEKEYRESWGLPNNPVEQIEVPEVKDVIVEEPQEEKVIDIQTPEVPDTYRDIDIIDHSIGLIQKAINLSRENEFKPIAYTFAELNLLFKVAVAAKERTDRFNKLIKNIVQRDTALSQSINYLQESVSAIQSQAEQMRFNSEQAQLMSKHFTKGKNENN